jgi:uncharacterized protein (DUF2252 family)
MSGVAELARDASPDERAASGKAARAWAKRTSHGEWEPAADRPDPVDVLEEQAKSRVGELVPLRYGRMLASAFAFYRGAAAVMAADLAQTPTSGLTAQLCGDAHLSNFGGYAAPDRYLVFDVNDFDETLPGPWEWDVKRLAASLALAGRERGFDATQRRAVVVAATREYRERMRELAAMRNLDVWYLRLDENMIRERLEAEATRKDEKKFDRGLAKAHAKDSLRAFAKLTERVDGELRIISDPPLIIPIDDLLSADDAGDAERRIEAIIAQYRKTLAPDRRHLFDSYRYVHSARKVVGVGSVGTRAWIALFVGRDEGDPLFLQLEEAQGSVLEPFAAPSAYEHQGERVVRGQRLTQAASDILLGWMSAPSIDGGVERHFYVRQLWDAKASVDVDRMTPDAMTGYGRICGATLARAHARSGDRCAIAGYLGNGSSFDEAVARFSESYADQNERDYARIHAAAREGRVSVLDDPY